MLYYRLGACSFASHIALTEAGAKFALVSVAAHAAIPETGVSRPDINPARVEGVNQ